MSAAKIEKVLARQRTKYALVFDLLQQQLTTYA
jgi:hypothetical protein